jgi:prepilin-type N-terminal cleavage/methylation domain-containing protein
MVRTEQKMNLNAPIRADRVSLRKSNHGFSLIELIFTVVILLIMTALAVPRTISAVRSFKLNAAAVTAANAVSSTRYQAIMNGYAFQLVLNPTSMTYQAKNKVPPAVAFSNFGRPIPLGGSPSIVLSAATTLQFNPSGTVSATAGAMNFTLTYAGLGKKITVSNLGNVAVTDFIP